MLHFCPGLPILLLGFKSDLQNDTKTVGTLLEISQKPVTQAEVSLLYLRSSEGNLTDKNNIGGGRKKTVYGCQVPGVFSKDRNRRSGDDRRNLSNCFTKPSLEVLQAIRGMSLRTLRRRGPLILEMFPSALIPTYRLPSRSATIITLMLSQPTGLLVTK